MTKRAVLVVFTMALTLALVNPMASAQAPCPAIPGVDERCEAWTAAVHGGDLGTTTGDFPSDLAVSPDGSAVFVSGSSRDESDPFQAASRWTVAAFDPGTGTERWRKRPSDLDRYALTTAITVTSDGRFVVATGTQRASFSAPASRMTTIAFDAVTGAEVWRSVWDGSALQDGGMDVVASDDTVYVVGYTRPEGKGYDYAAVAYDAATGEERWSSTWAGIADGRDDNPFAAGLSPDGSLLHVTGWSAGSGEFNNDYGTVTFHTRGEDAGEVAWEARFDGVGSRAPDQANDLAVDADGTVYVTGISDDVPGGPPFSVNYDIATLAYEGATGAQRWVKRHRFGSNTWNVGEAIAVSGNRVVVGGLTYTSSSKDSDPVILALDASSGAVVWSHQETLAQHEGEYGLDVAAAGNTAFLVGVSGKSVGSVIPGTSGTIASQATYAYDLAGGSRRWLARYNPMPFDNVSGQAVVPAANGLRAFVLSQITRNANPDGNIYDIGVTAYDS